MCGCTCTFVTGGFIQAFYREYGHENMSTTSFIGEENFFTLDDILLNCYVGGRPCQDFTEAFIPLPRQVLMSKLLPYFFIQRMRSISRKTRTIFVLRPFLIVQLLWKEEHYYTISGSHYCEAVGYTITVSVKPDVDLLLSGTAVVSVCSVRMRQRRHPKKSRGDSA